MMGMSEDEENMSASDDLPNDLKDVLTADDVKRFGNTFAAHLMANAVSYEKSVPIREVPEDPKDIKPFSVVAAVLSDEILSTLPNCLNLLLRDFSRKQKMAYRKVGDFRVFYGTLGQLNAVTEELPNFVKKYRVRKERSGEDFEIDPDEPKHRRYSRKGRKFVFDPILKGSEKNIISTPSPTAESRRLSGRLSTKPRKSYATLFSRPVGPKSGEKAEKNENKEEDGDSDEPVDIDAEVKKLQEEAINKRREEKKMQKIAIKKEEEEIEDVKDIEEPSPPVKKARGRPPKVSNTVADVPQDVKDTETEPSPPVKKTRGRPPKVSSPVADVAEVQNQSTPVLKKKRGRPPKVRDENDVTCDICLKDFIFPGVMRKHRSAHFETDGSLGEAAIIVHLATLREKKMEENLPEDLAIQVKNYQEKQGGGESMNEISDVVNDNSIKEEYLNVVQPKKRGRKPLCEKGETSSAKDEESSGGKDVKQGSYPCDQCCCILLTERALNIHKKNVHETKKKQKPKDELELKCPHCDFTSNRTQNFARHIKSHGRPNMFRCNLCSYSNKMRSEVLRHQRNTHATKSFKCEECGSMHRNKSLLSMHINLKHKKIYSVICDQCGKELISRRAYKDHVEKCHTTKEKDSSRTQIMCNMCARILPSNKSFEQHLAKFHGEDKDAQEMKQVNEGVQILEDGFQCKHCQEYKNAAAREVRRHILRVHMARTHQCDQCKAAFPLEKLLQKHIRVVHYGLEKKKCPYCNKWFRNNSFLTAHVKRVHSGDDNECPICRKQFTDKRTLESHSEIHKPPEERTFKFSCDHCDKKFRVLSNLEYHIMSHTGERPHGCEICGKTFKTKHVLERHLTTHSDHRPFKCNVCDKSFKLKKYLDVHFLVHTGDKYACSQCHKAFANEEALEKHICKVMVIANMPQEEKIEAPPVELVSVAMPSDGLDAGGLTDGLAENKSGMQMYCFMCSSCGAGFVDTESATSHICPLQAKANDTEVKMDQDEGQIDGLAQSLSDHQHYSVIEEGPQTSSVTGEMGIQGAFVEKTTAVSDIPLTVMQSSPPDLSAAQPETSGTAVILTPPSQEEQANLQVTGDDIPQAEMYMCGICNTLFMTQNEVQDHLQVHIQEIGSPDAAAMAVADDGVASQMEQQEQTSAGLTQQQLQLVDVRSLTVAESDPLDATGELELPMQGIL